MRTGSGWDIFDEKHGKNEINTTEIFQTINEWFAKIRSSQND